MDEETQRQGGFDREVRVLRWRAPRARSLRVPGCDGRPGQPDGDVAPTDQGSLVGRPVSDAVFRLVFQMDSRLHPSSLVWVPLNLTLDCRVAPGDCSPEALTRTGLGGFHHPALPLMWLMAMRPRFGSTTFRISGDMSPDVNAPVMGPFESSHQHGPPLLGRVQVGTRSPTSSLVCSPPTPSLPSAAAPVVPGRWPNPVPRATRRKKGLPGAWAVLFQRAVGSDPAGCASRLAHRVETAIAFRLHNALGTQNERYFVAVNPTAHSLACLRIGVFVTADAARLATCVGGSPFTGRVSHPLDGEQSFMTSPHRHSPLTSLAWSHCATTPHRIVTPL